MQATWKTRKQEMKKAKFKYRNNYFLQILFEVFFFKNTSLKTNNLFVLN